MNPGIYTSLSNEDYHNGDGLSSTGCKLLLRSPGHFRYSKEHPREQTANMLLGSVTHSLLLEPDKEDYIPEPPVNKRTNAGKDELAAYAAEHPNQTLVPIETYSTAQAMAQSVLAHPIARILFANGRPEVSRYWKDPETGLLCKTRNDWENNDHNLIVDLKTATDASRHAFLRNVVNFSYELQNAYYLDGAAASGDEFVGFVFVAVENTPPHAVAIYTLPDELIHKGRMMYRKALDLYKQSLLTNEWPFYPEEIQVLDAPRWALEIK